ncbi:MAG TPA: tRNA 2-thiouridine(34) synthase MnmA [Gemmatimonadaceae bacterium]|nr:tRNA 2-thiouridine(34) synthase MnmA [Gemmatimonadaceae bacterium]
MTRRREREARPRRPRVLVAMSGGVDSSVAAAVLAREGYDVVGVTMKLHSDGTELPDRPCCSLDSANDARRVAERIGVPHYVINLESPFKRDVIDDFVSEYVAGRTPIPCVRCNTFTKFRDLVITADRIDADFVATGHYARVIHGALYRGTDDAKDQTYFLWGIDRAVLPRLMLPVGALTKAQTRALAAELGLLHVAEKPESQEICFVPDGNYANVLEQKLGADHPALSAGPLMTLEGTIIGEHDGYARFTVGQRRGLPGGSAEAMYVVAIRPAERAVVIGPRDALLGRGVIARDVSWLSDRGPGIGDRVFARVRHRAPLVAGEVVRSESNEIEIALESPISAITAGQSLVLYDENDRVLGGGFIKTSSASARRALPLAMA